jgi:hypothetical protein
MKRKDYVEELFEPIAEFRERDDLWLRAQMLQLSDAVQNGTPSNGFDDIVKLPTAFAVEKLGEFKTRYAKAELTQDNVEAILRAIELRRMHLTYLLMWHAFSALGATGGSLVEGSPLFLNALCHELYTQALDALKDPKAAHEMATSQIVYHFSLMYHKISGKPIYIPSAGLTEALMYTEFRDLPAELLRMPHNALYIEVPENAELYVPNSESGLHPLVGIYVCKRTALSVEDVTVWTRPEGETLAEPLWGLQVLLIGKNKPYDTEQSGLFNDALLHFYLPAYPSDTLEKVIHLTAKSFAKWDFGNKLFKTAHTRIAPKHPRLTPEQQHVVEEELESWSDDGVHRLLRFIVNTLIYITLPDAELDERYLDPEVAHLFAKAQKAPKGSTKRAKLHKELAKADKQKVVLLGSSVKIDRSHLKAHTDGSGSVSTGRKLAVQYIRRGHWRNQPYGPGRTLTRLQWIRPTAVGPKDAPLKKIMYELGSS